jgi:hypothetical protein
VGVVQATVGLTQVGEVKLDTDRMPVQGEGAVLGQDYTVWQTSSRERPVNIQEATKI